MIYIHMAIWINSKTYKVALSRLSQINVVLKAVSRGQQSQTQGTLCRSSAVLQFKGTHNYYCMS